MRAITHKKYGPPDVLELTELEKPTPNDYEVLVKIKAATVTAVDSIFRQGNQFFARMATGITKPKKAVLGTDFAGVVEEVGDKVTLYKKGNEVFGANDSAAGTHAEYICLPEEGSFVTKPASISSEEASAIPYGALTALPFLRDSGKIKSGDKILVIGASGAVGTFAVQFARYYGAEVTGLCSTSNVELVKSLGADKVIDYTKEDFTKNNEIYDIIFDTVGKSSFSACKKSLKKDGKFLTTVVGFPILFQMLWTSKLSSKKAIISFTGMRSESAKKKDLIFIKELVEQGKLKTVIDKTFRLEQTVEAHKYVDVGHKKGNVVVTVN